VDGGLLVLQSAVFVGTLVGVFCGCCGWWTVGAVVSGLLVLQSVDCWCCGQWIVGAVVGGLLALQSVVFVGAAVSGL